MIITEENLSVITRYPEVRRETWRIVADKVEREKFITANAMTNISCCPESGEQSSQPIAMLEERVLYVL